MLLCWVCTADSTASRLSRKKILPSWAARALNPVTGAVIGRYDGGIHSSMVVVGGPSGLELDGIENTVASLSKGALPVPPASGNSVGNSLPSSRVLPASSGAFTYWPARMAAIGLVGSTLA